MLADSHPARRAGRAAVITLPEEIDVTNAAQVSAALERPLAEGAAVLVADMSATMFCASAGVRALVGARRDAAAAGAVLRVAAAGPAVRRILELIGADEVLDIYPTVEAALAGPLRVAPPAGQEPADPRDRIFWAEAQD